MLRNFFMHEIFFLHLFIYALFALTDTGEIILIINEINLHMLLQ